MIMYGQTVTITDNKIVLQALALINDCNKYKMDLTTNGVVITDAIKFVQTNKEKLTVSAKEEDNGKESKEPDYDEVRCRSSRTRKRETGEIEEETMNNFSELVSKGINSRRRKVRNLILISNNAKP